MSSVDFDDSLRTPQMRRNASLEQLLAQLGQALVGVDDRLQVSTDERYTKLFLFGAMRSGTTAFMQWLAATGLFAYPSNLLSRFYASPLIGAKIQQLIADPTFNFKDEFVDLVVPDELSSDNGKTKGVLAPNEFWYFWRRHLPDLVPGFADTETHRRSGDIQRLGYELNSLANIFEKPFVIKAMILNQNLDLLDGLFNWPLFIWLKRDPILTIQSVLQARLRQYGTLDTWYSFKVREYPDLCTLPPLAAVAGQVASIHHSLSEQFARVPDERKLVIAYEAFCADPGQVLDAICARLAPHELPSVRRIPQAQLQCSKQWHLATYSRDAVARAYEQAEASLASR